MTSIRIYCPIIYIPIDNIEVQDLVLAISIPDQVSQDCIDSAGSVLNVYHGFNRCIEDLCNSSARNVEQFGVRIKNEGIWSSLALVEVFPLFPLDWSRECSKRT